MTVVPFFRRGGLPRSGGPEWQAATNQSLSKHVDNDLLLQIKMLSVTSWRGMRDIMRLSWRAQPTAYPSELEG